MPSTADGSRAGVMGTPTSCCRFMPPPSSQMCATSFAPLLLFRANMYSSATVGLGLSSFPLEPPPCSSAMSDDLPDPCWPVNSE